MPSITATPGVSGYSGSGVDWSGSNVTLDVGQQSKTRRHAIATQFAAIHDGCTITSIQVSVTASCSISIASGTQYYSADFAGVYVSGTGLTTTPTVKSATGGAGTRPATVRAGVAAVFTRNNDTFYPVTNTLSNLTITINYVDNGVPSFAQFVF